MRFLAFTAPLRSSSPSPRRSIFFGGYYSVAESEDNPAMVDWALASVRGASVAGHATERRPPIPMIPRR